MQKILAYLEEMSITSDDTQDIRLKKFTLVLVSSFCSIVAFIWGTFYFSIFGVSIQILPPYSFSVIIGLSLLYTFKTKNFKILLFNQLFFILITPVVLQWILGGFAASGAVILWSILGPFGSLMFQPLKVALRWFFVYITLVGISLYFDNYFSLYAPEILPVHQVIFFVMNVVGPSFTIFFTMMYFFRAFQEVHNRSEELLLNILPQPIAERLKTAEETIADVYDDVTVLFADIVGFTKMSIESPGTVVNMLNQVFSAFDELAKKFKVEKIKTIGDAYMVVGGVPHHQEAHATAIAEVALSMLDEIAKISKINRKKFKIRIGINSGSVVAGVIGHYKFAYDLWGDTVNTASRMESHGKENKIQISEDTYKLIKDKFVCKKRGKIVIKGHGKMNTYFLVSKK